MDSIISKERRILAATGLFLFFSFLYFLPLDIPHKIFLPLLVLAVFSVGRLPWPMAVAFGFSCLGDFAGSFKAQSGDVAFLGQMGSFGVAHVFFVLFFLMWGLKQKQAYAASSRSLEKRSRKSSVRKPAAKASANSKPESLEVVKAEKPPQQQGLYMGMVMAVTLIVAYSALTNVVVCVPEGMLRTCVTGYVVVISVMLWSALMNGDWIWGLGAALFVCSDFILAWNMFVNPLPFSRYLIMVPYYSAQLIFFLRTASKTSSPAAR